MARKRENFRILRNQHGFSLMEIMVAVGMMGVLSVAMMSMQRNGVLGQKSLSAQDDSRVLTDLIATMLTDQTACTNTFAGLSPTAGATNMVLKDGGGNAQYSAGNSYGTRMTILAGIYMGETAATQKSANVDKRTGLVQWTPGAVNPNQGLALVMLDWQQTGTGSNQGVGVKDFWRYFMINATISAGNIVSCNAVRGDAAQNGVGTANYIPKWVTSTQLGNSVMYQSGSNIGIGTTGATSELSVIGDGTGVAQIGSAACGGNYVGITLGQTAAPTCSNYNILSNPSAPALLLNRPTGSDVEIRENNVPAVYFASGGTVGIGVAAPSYTLHTVGTIGTTGASAGYFMGDRSTANSGAWYRTGDYTRLWDSRIGDTAYFYNGATLASTQFSVGTTPYTNAIISADGEITSTLGAYGQFRMVGGNYGIMWRNDGANLYLLPTASGNQYGTWTGYRPFVYYFATGNVALNLDGSSSTGVGIAPSSRLQVDGEFRVGESTLGDTYVYMFRDPASGHMTIDTHNAANSAKDPLLINPWGGTVSVGYNAGIGGAFNVYYPAGSVHGIVAYGYPDAAHYGVYGQSGSYWGALGRSDGYSFVGTGHIWIPASYVVYAGNFASSSDARLKEKIRPVDNSLQLIEKLKPVHFYWRPGTEQYNAEKEQKEQIGFIAQDVEKVLPEVVGKVKYPGVPAVKSPDGKDKPHLPTLNEKLGETLTIDYGKLTPVAIAGVKALKELFDSFKAEFKKEHENVLALIEKVRKDLEKLDFQLKDLAKDMASFRTSVLETREELARFGKNDESRGRELASLKDDLKELKAKNEDLAKENKSVKRENEAIKAYLCGKDPKAPICH
jgi:prepilin-type N-terminal cleavage/methylation domain-containing protein